MDANIITSIITTAGLITVAILTYVLNKKNNTADTLKKMSEKKLNDAEIEKIRVETANAQMGMWKDLNKELEEKVEDVEKKYDDLQKDIVDLKAKLETEKFTIKKLEGKIERIRKWFVRNAQKLDDAKIEPIPIEAWP